MVKVIETFLIGGLTRSDIRHPATSHLSPGAESARKEILI